MGLWSEIETSMVPEAIISEGLMFVKIRSIVLLLLFVTLVGLLIISRSLLSPIILRSRDRTGLCFWGKSIFRSPRTIRSLFSTLSSKLSFSRVF